MKMVPFLLSNLKLLKNFYWDLLDIPADISWCTKTVTLCLA